MISRVTASATNARPRLSVVVVDATVDSSSIVPTVDSYSVKPKVSASYVDPIATTTTVVPATEIAYINLVFTADIDLSGLFSFKVESITLQDGTSFAFTKSPTESFVVLDGVAHQFSKPVSDSISLMDFAVTVLIFLRELSDTQSISDATALSFERLFIEYVYAFDVATRFFEKSNADLMSVADLLSMVVTKRHDSLTTIYDAEQKTFQKIKTDSVVTLDSGFVLQQNYIDLTYFAEDYVGVGYAF